MEDKQLDRLIEDKLNQLSVPYQAKSWEQLQHRLEKEEVADDHAFDKAMHQRLADIEVSYVPKYWDILSARLEKEDELRRQFVQLKSIELGLLLLLLITFVQIFPTALDKINQVTSNQSSINTTVIPKETPPESAAALSDLSTAEASEWSNKKQHDANQASIEGIEIKISSNQRIQNTDLSDATTVSLPASAQYVILLDKKVADSQNEMISTTLEHQEMIPVSDELESDLALLLNEQNFASIVNSIPIAKAKKHLKISMFTSVNGDYIFTPYDEILDQEAYSRVSTNYGGGFSVSWEWKRWEVGTGLAYNHKEYSPEQVSVLFGNSVDGFNMEGLTNIELNTFQIPLQVKYDVKQTPKWHFYAASGVSLHIITQANYDVKSTMASQLNIGNSSTISKNEYQLSAFQLDRFRKYARPSSPQSDKLKEKKFADGWMSGGNFRENSYYTANIGLGVERHLDERWSVFVQPTYRQNVPFISGGIGPNQDQISTLEVVIGAKVGL